MFADQKLVTGFILITSGVLVWSLSYAVARNVHWMTVYTGDLRSSDHFIFLSTIIRDISRYTACAAYRGDSVCTSDG